MVGHAKWSLALRRQAVCVRLVSPARAVNKVNRSRRSSHFGQRELFLLSDVTSVTTTRPVPTLSMISQSLSSGTTALVFLNYTSVPYTCDDASLACLAYSSFCAREIEFGGIPCRVLCPRTCNTCESRRFIRPSLSNLLFGCRL